MQAGVHLPRIGRKARSRRDPRARALAGPVLAGVAWEATRPGLALFVALNCLALPAFARMNGESPQRGATIGAPASN